jgi:hypothetical protein
VTNGSRGASVSPSMRRVWPPSTEDGVAVMKRPSSIEVTRAPVRPTWRRWRRPLPSITSYTALPTLTYTRGSDRRCGGGPHADGTARAPDVRRVGADRSGPPRTSDTETQPDPSWATNTAPRCPTIDAGCHAEEGSTMAGPTARSRLSGARLMCPPPSGNASAHPSPNGASSEAAVVGRCSAPGFSPRHGSARAGPRRDRAAARTPCPRSSSMPRPRAARPRSRRPRADSPRRVGRAVGITRGASSTIDGCA